MSDLTPAGEIIEAARVRARKSKRQAAKDADLSEGRWRQVVTGVQKVGQGQTIPARPKRETLIAMAAAVEADVDSILEASGMEPLTEEERAPASGEADALAEVREELRLLREEVTQLKRRSS